MKDIKDVATTLEKNLRLEHLIKLAKTKGLNEHEKTELHLLLITTDRSQCVEIKPTVSPKR